eukprot:Amastigsp_a676391_915.p2 type:complete len:121 gc:universal Amastigsp_a676391_915:430-792(+)
MPERDIVGLVDERHDALRVVLGHREQMLEDLGDTESQRRRKVVEDEMRIRLGDCFADRDLVPRDHPREIEVRRRPVWQMADDEPVGDAAMLLGNDDVRHLVGQARLDQVFHAVAAAVDRL